MYFFFDLFIFKPTEPTRIPSVYVSLYFLDYIANIN